jgi:uncharacterized coiled-coil DUF342 family protein
MADTKDTFWKDIELPINEDYQENGYQIVNPVDVSEKFVLAISYSTALGEKAENLTEQLAGLEEELADVTTKLNRLRRQILADNINKLKSSWSAEIVDAFILASAGDQTERLTKLEKEHDELTGDIRALKPKLLKVEKRLKLLEKNMEWAKQFLDYEKLMHRIKMGNRH